VNHINTKYLENVSNRPLTLRCMFTLIWLWW